MVSTGTNDARLYVELTLDDDERARLRNLWRGPVRFAEPGTTGADDARALADADVALGNPRADRVASAPRLRWLQLASVGIDSYLGLDWAVLGRRLTVTNLGDLFADPVAESCLAGILALHRGIDELSGLRARGTWAKPVVRPRLRLLTGARVLVLGRGSIARRLAELLGPFGCAVSHFARGTGTSVPSRSSMSDCRPSTWWSDFCRAPRRPAVCSTRVGSPGCGPARSW